MEVWDPCTRRITWRYWGFKSHDKFCAVCKQKNRRRVKYNTYLDVVNSVNSNSNHTIPFVVLVKQYFFSNSANRYHTLSESVSPCVTVGGRVPGREDGTGDRGHGRQSYTKCKKGVGLRQKIHTQWLGIAHYQIKWEQNIHTHTLLIEKPLLLNQFQLIWWVTLMWDWISSSSFFLFVLWTNLHQTARNKSHD